MTNNLQALYDILGEAWKAGRDYAMKASAYPSASDALFPLAARMETEVRGLVDAELETSLQIAAAWLAACSEAREALRILGIFHKPTEDLWRARGVLFGNVRKAAEYVNAVHMESLPSSPEREI